MGCGRRRKDRRWAFRRALELQEISKREKPGLNLSPCWIRSITKYSALRLVLGSDRRGQAGRRKQRIALGKTHVLGMKIALGEMGAADPVVIRLDGRVLCPSGKAA
jgi:hypothetical protein